MKLSVADKETEMAVLHKEMEGLKGENMKLRLDSIEKSGRCLDKRVIIKREVE